MCINTKPTIVLDPGHNPVHINPNDSGALSIKGIYEVDYNDRFVAELKPKLEKIGWNVVLTRTPNQSISLTKRAKIANHINADLFLSIHHDSTRKHYVEIFNNNGKTAQRTIEPISGYSIHVSYKNANPSLSHCFAKTIAKHVLPLGRLPTMHHTDQYKGKGLLLLDTNYGIYLHNNLVVLRSTNMPAILFEVGVIPDEKDEAWISNKTKRNDIENAIVKAVKEYPKTCNTFRQPES